MSEEEERETLVEAAVRLLNTADPFEKARLGDSLANAWLDGSITRPYDPRVDLPVPDRPARLAEVCDPRCQARQLFDKMPLLICWPLSFSCRIMYVFFVIVQVKLVSPSLMPKLGKAGSLSSRQAIVHSLAHTESWAIDLSWVKSLPFLSIYFRRYIPPLGAAYHCMVLSPPDSSNRLLHR